MFFANFRARILISSYFTFGDEIILLEGHQYILCSYQLKTKKFTFVNQTTYNKIFHYIFVNFFFDKNWRCLKRYILNFLNPKTRLLKLKLLF